MKHRALVYGGLGNVGSERIIPALDLIQGRFDIDYAIVDIQDIPMRYHRTVIWFQYLSPQKAVSYLNNHTLLGYL